MGDVDDIKDKIDIADLMSEYIKLVPAGANFKALCPFHNEKTPSMMISADKNIFKCFGCGAGGDIFEFLMKIEGLEFPEAKRTLAKKAGVTIAGYDNKGDGQKAPLIRAMEMARKYYHYVLLNSNSAKPAMEYLLERGLDEDTIIDWQIGYSPDGWNSLYDFLRQRDFTDLDIFNAGLTQKKKVGSGYYDRFRGRIMFPISSASGDTIAFTARVSPSNEATEKMGKYINSPQTKIYDKSRVVFALNKAKSSIKASDKAIIVEGQMDAITAHQKGFKNVVATSGTALTIDQFKLIKRHTNNFLFALDSDLAGQNAIDKGDTLAKALDLYVVESEDARGKKHTYVDSERSYNISVKVVEIKGAKDPDELIRKDEAKWKEAVDNAKPIMEYYFDRAVDGVDTSDISQQLQAVRRLLPKINKINDKVEIDHWLKRLSQKLSVSENILREEMVKITSSPKNYGNKGNDQNKEENSNIGSASELIPKDLELFRRILAIVIKYPVLLTKLDDEFSADYIHSPLSLDLYKRLMLFYTEEVKKKIDPTVDNSDIDLYNRFKGHLEGNNADKQITDLLDESFLLSEKDFLELEERAAISELDTLIMILKVDYLNNKINSLNKELKEAEDRSDKEAIDNLSQELLQLLRQKQ